MMCGSSPLFTFLALMATVVNTLLAFFVYRKDPRNQANRIFLVLMVCFIFWALLELKILCTQGTRQFFWIKSMLCPVLFLAPAFYHFTFVFPREDKRLKNHGRLLNLLYIPAAALTGLLLTAPASIPSFASLHHSLQLFDWGFAIQNHLLLKLLRGYLLVFMVLVLFNLRSRLAAARDKQEKIQINYTISALLFPLTIGSAVLLIFKYLLVGRGYENVTYYIFGLFPTISILMSIVLAYSIARYHLMGIRIIINKTLLYTLITGSLATVYVGVEELVETLFQRLLPSDISFYGIVAALVVALISVPLYRHLSHFVDNLFSREKKSREALLEQAVEKLGMTRDRNLLQEIILEVMAGWLAIDRAGLYLAGDDETFRQCASRGGAAENVDDTGVPAGGAIARVLEPKKRPFSTDGAIDNNAAEDGPDRSALAAFCRRQGFTMLVPLLVDNTLTGFVGLGRRENNEPCTTEDRDLLSAMGYQAAVCMEHCRLKEKFATYEQFEQEYRVARSLHRRFIPRHPPAISGYSLLFSCLPSPDIRGNFLAFVPLDTCRYGIVLGDVPGRGVEAVTRLALVYGLVKGEIQADRPPGEVLARLNAVLVEMEEKETVCPLFYGIIDHEKHRFSFCNAHDTRPQLLNGSRITVLEKNGGLPGLRRESSYRTGEIVLQPDDRIVLHSKGVVRADRLTALMTGAAVDNEDLVRFLEDENAAPECCGAEDKTVIVIRRGG